MTAADWDRRIARAGELEVAYPAVSEMLRFYAVIARLQKQVYLTAPQDVTALASFVPKLRRLAKRDETISASDLDAFWRGGDLDTVETFLARVLLEPYAAYHPGCPYCTRAPQAAVLRPEGYGAKRSLVCALCASERPFPRVECPHCGARDFDKLPVYTAPEFPHLRVDACDACLTYLKTIDLTKNGLAVPVVDEIAALSLDLWSVEQGYSKLQPNLLAL